MAQLAARPARVRSIAVSGKVAHDTSHRSQDSAPVEAPDSFAYDVAGALDEHRDLFQVQLEPWYYDTQTVAEQGDPHASRSDEVLSRARVRQVAIIMRDVL